MPKKIMQRTASDNKYLHKDFHGAMSNGIEYLHKTYGEGSVREYLRNFTRTYYAPLISDVKGRGLIALKEHFDSLYEVEGGSVEITFTKDELVVKVHECPAVKHLRDNNIPVARLFYETSKTVNEAICEETDYTAEWNDGDREIGSSIQRFYRRV